MSDEAFRKAIEEMVEQEANPANGKETRWRGILMRPNEIAALGKESVEGRDYWSGDPYDIPLLPDPTLPVLTCQGVRAIGKYAYSGERVSSLMEKGILD